MYERDVLKNLKIIDNMDLNRHTGMVTDAYGDTIHWTELPAFKDAAEEVTTWQTQPHPMPYVLDWQAEIPGLPMPYTVYEQVMEFNSNGYDINNGLCAEFADQLVLKCGGRVYDIGNNSMNYFDAFPNHSWVYYEGKHYDAETPFGVDYWWELPIFKRMAVQHFIWLEGKANAEKLRAGIDADIWYDASDYGDEEKAEYIGDVQDAMNFAAIFMDREYTAQRVLADVREAYVNEIDSIPPLRRWVNGDDEVGLETEDGCSICTLERGTDDLTRKLIKLTVGDTDLHGILMGDIVSELTDN